MDDIEKFLHYLRYEVNRAANTVTAYDRDLRLMVNFMTGGHPENFSASDVTTSDIRAWLSDMGRRGEQPSSIRRRTLAVRSFYKYLQRRGVVINNPAHAITLAKLSKPLPHFIKEDELERLLSELSERMSICPDDIMTARDHLVIHLLYATGMRRAEAIGLTDADVSRERRELRIFGKGRKERIVPIAEELCAEISRWQVMRDNQWPDLPRPAHLIATAHGGMTDTMIGKIVKRLLGSTSTDKKSAHTLRHSFATSMLNGGAELDCVREMLGHTSVSTTQIYTHLTVDELRRQYDRAHPRSPHSKDR
ncbi:MAG: tyrosine-type recombinase/integrase [Muribaculaceae bacterium]|nr:tyrosine-type recombinase/integrase [Muribaculaceae bacterium]